MTADTVILLLLTLAVCLLARLIYLLEKRMSADLQALAAQVAINTSAEQSAIVLIKALADKINASADDPQAVRDLAAQLKASGDALGAAVVANTTP